MYLGNRNPWTDRYKILHFECRPWRNHACHFLWRSVKGFWCGEGSNSGLFYWLGSSPLKHSRTTVRVCDDYHKRTAVPPCVNGDIAIQWEWSNFDFSHNPNPLTEIDKTLHIWLCLRNEQVTQNFCQSVVRKHPANCVKYNTKNFSIFIFSNDSPTEVTCG